MSQKILAIGLTIVGVALMAVPGIGEAIGLPMISTALGISSAMVIGLGAEIAGSVLLGSAKPKLGNSMGAPMAAINLS